MERELRKVSRQISKKPGLKFSFPLLNSFFEIKLMKWLNSYETTQTQQKRTTSRALDFIVNLVSCVMELFSICFLIHNNRIYKFTYKISIKLDLHFITFQLEIQPEILFLMPENVTPQFLFRWGSSLLHQQILTPVPHSLHQVLVLHSLGKSANSILPGFKTN